MTQHVRAMGAYTFNNRNIAGGSISVQRGDVLPVNHWAVLASTAGTFQDVELDAAATQLVEKRSAVLEDLAAVEARNGGRMFGQWPDGDRERHTRQERASERLAEEIRSAVDTAERGRLLGLVRAGATETGDEPRANAAAATHQVSRPSSLRDQAARLVDAEHRSSRIPDHAAERVEKLLDSTAPGDSDFTARWALATGREAYRTAFEKVMTDPERGHLLWTTEEANAYRAAEAFHKEIKRRDALEARALGIGTNAGGGFLLPFQLDPSILLTSNGSLNPLRRLGRVEQIVSSAWHGITSAGVTAEWKAEAAEVADASPSFEQPPVPVHFGDAFVPFSFELEMDAVQFTQMIRNLLIDAADQLQAAAYWKGTGTGQPTGILTALPGGSKIASATADALVMPDMTKVQNALPPRFQDNAQWCANLTTINGIASFETTGGALRFPEVANGQLLHRPLNEASLMDSVGATAGAGNDSVLLYGDFKQFLIVDRIGTSIEPVQHLFGANRRPTGQRGALMWFRTGSDVLVDNAFRLLTA